MRWVSCIRVWYVRRQAEEAEVSPFSPPTWGSERGIEVTACSHLEASAVTCWGRFKAKRKLRGIVAIIGIEQYGFAKMAL